MTIKVLATGTGWLGGGVESIETNIYELIENCEHELIIGTYSFGIGALQLLVYLKGALKRKVNINIFINDFSSQSNIIQQELKSLLSESLNINIYNFQPSENNDLHAKIIIADRKAAIIGSSNLSRRGFITNHELAVLIQDSEVYKIATAFDRLKRLNNVNKI